MPIPFAGAPAFRFTSKVTLSNVGPRPLRKWALSFGYVNQEAIGEVDGAVVPAGVQLPVAGELIASTFIHTQRKWALSFGYVNQEAIGEVDGAVVPAGMQLPVAGNGLELSSPPGAAFLLTAVQSGGDKRRYQHVVQLAGTEVAATSAAAALPRTISLDATGFTCSDKPMLSGRNDTLRVCCASTGPSQETQVAPLPLPTLPISSQGLQIQWDVLSANSSQYTVAVRVSNTQRYTAVSSDPGWSLQWAWQMGEMILECDGCQTLRQGDCITCPACIDKSSITNPYSCDSIPTIVDGSPLNGSLSAAAYDNSSSSTTFTMLLAKAQQYWDPSLLTFPANFTAQVSNQSQGFACDPPAALSPAALETVVGGRQTMNAKASYVVTCGTVAGSGPLPTCSVSASAFFNSSLAPSPSCACGCSSSNTSQGGGQCDATTSASTDPAATVLLGEDLAGLVVPGQSPGGSGGAGAGRGGEWMEKKDDGMSGGEGAGGRVEEGKRAMKTWGGWWYWGSQGVSTWKNRKMVFGKGEGKRGVRTW
ncbi:unnamed protein product [Closterium sp. Naga37s-1]|nr:unnamed protein product [Closterium sp. Naga37s-1]